MREKTMLYLDRDLLEEIKHLKIARRESHAEVIKRLIAKERKEILRRRIWTR